MEGHKTKAVAHGAPQKQIKSDNTSSPIDGFAVEELIKRIIESPNDETSEKVLRKLSVRIQESRSGPLPSAQEFQQYENAFKGAAERILTSAEKEGDHRRAREEQIVTGELKCRNKGLNFGLAACAMFAFVTVLAVYMNQPWVAGAIGCSSIATIVLAFVQGGKKEK